MVNSIDVLKMLSVNHPFAANYPFGIPQLTDSELLLNYKILSSLFPTNDITDRVELEINRRGIADVCHNITERFQND